MAPSKKRKAVAAAEAEPASDVALTPPVKRGRGRPSKAEKGASEQTQPVTTPPTKRGRPSKADKASLLLTQAPIPTSTLVHRNNNTPVKASGKASATANTSLRRSSRRESGGDADANEGAAANASRATRSSKNGTTSGAVVAVKETKAKAKGKARAASPVKVAAKKSKTTSGVATKKMSAKAKGKAALTATNNEDEDDDDSSSDEDSPAEPTMPGNRRAKVSVNVPSPRLAVEKAEDADEEDADEPNYWLMKAEPESRLEKGKDVKFSIDDLKNAPEPEGWDGVRNPTARNNMRSMMKGDQAFFYHSNCKVPGIAGIMEIVEEHTPDESALDPEHPYYDPKATAENPKWCKVRVSFRQKFPDFVRLKELQKYAREGGILQNMQTLKQTRLSVSKVSKKEWDFILTLGGHEDDDQVSARNIGERVVDGILSEEMDTKNFGAITTPAWMGAMSTDATSNVAAADTKV
ncbi:MAG: hypothetical protein Q9195_003074 [Heterodermia aff. obscurata]